MKLLRLLSTMLAVVALITLSAAPAVAATPAEAAAGIRDDGVFVEDGASANESEVGAAVAEARRDGEELSIVIVSEEPISGATAFADAVFDRLGSGLIIVIAPESVGFSGVPEIYSAAELDAAIETALNRGGNDSAIVEGLADALGFEPTPVGGVTTTAQIGAAEPAASGGGGFGFLWVIVIVGGLIALFWWMSRRAKRRAVEQTDSRLDAVRAEVQKQVDAVANDILELEDEVRVAENSRADRFYEDASATYQAAVERLSGADTPGDLLEISNDLDEAIWQLDSAEAILDGNSLPDRPVRRRLEPQTAPQTRTADRTSQGQPQYGRRPTRRSSYSSSGVMDLLVMLGTGVLSQRGGGGLFGGRPSRAQPVPRRRPMRSQSKTGGGTIVPGPSTPRTTSRRSSSPRGSGSSGKRIRGGRRRRR